jgi:hypothetical protein
MSLLITDIQEGLTKLSTGLFLLAQGLAGKIFLVSSRLLDITQSVALKSLLDCPTDCCINCKFHRDGSNPITISL